MIDLKPIFEHSLSIKQLFDSQGWQFLEERLKAELNVIDGKINDFMTMNRTLTVDDMPTLNELRTHKKDLEMFIGLKEELVESISPEENSEESNQNSPR